MLAAGWEDGVSLIGFRVSSFRVEGLEVQGLGFRVYRGLGISKGYIGII